MLHENLDDIFKFFTEIEDKNMSLKIENNNIIVKKNFFKFKRHKKIF